MLLSIQDVVLVRVHGGEMETDGGDAGLLGHVGSDDLINSRKDTSTCAFIHVMSHAGEEGSWIHRRSNSWRLDRRGIGRV
jgi:hypothetical protein